MGGLVMSKNLGGPMKNFMETSREIEHPNLEHALEKEAWNLLVGIPCKILNPIEEVMKILREAQKYMKPMEEAMEILDEIERQKIGEMNVTSTGSGFTGSGFTEYAK